MSKEKQKLVPALRFPEFKNDGEWNQVNFYGLLEEILDFRGRTPKKIGMDWGGGNIISLSANNVKNGYIDFETECNLGSETLYKKWMGKVNLEKNDIIFTMEAPLGKALLVPDSKKYILSQRVVAFKTKNSIVNEFLIQLIWSFQFQSKLKKLSTGSTAKGINQKTLKTVNIRIPPNPKEQQKIANCLSYLDTLITAETEKLAYLKDHKKGLLQQLFPLKGETKPQFRFKEFENDGDWEEKTIDEVFNIYAGGDKPSSISNIKTKEFYIPILSNGINDKALYGWTDKPKVEIPSLTISARGTIGWTSIQDKPFYPIVRLIVINPKVDLNLKYAYYFMKKIENNYKVPPAGIPQLTKPMIKKVNILIPVSLEEQQKIADFLSSIDELVEAQTTKIEALKEHKKGLMQQLFPNINELTV